MRNTLQARDIASEQHIPEPFLEQVLATLRRAGIVSATRGAAGGYELARAPEKITAADILRALSGPLVPAKLLQRQERGNSTESAVVRINVWSAVEQSLAGTLERLTLRELLEETQASSQRDAYGMHI